MKRLLSSRQQGTYVLILRLPTARSVHVGRLGRVTLATGFYAYVGSALGPGGLGGRLSHHVKALARPRWHIDYLRTVARIEKVWITMQGRRREHDWARLLRQWPGVSAAVRRFGTSDCRCETHLFQWLRQPALATFRRLVRNHFPKDAPVRAAKWSPSEGTWRSTHADRGWQADHESVH